MIGPIAVAWAVVALLLMLGLSSDWARDGTKPPWRIVPWSFVLAPVFVVALAFFALYWLLDQLSGGYISKRLEL